MNQAIADPRPRASQSADGVTIAGWRCSDCGHPVLHDVLRCPVCRGAVAEASFSVEGEIFASTCLRVRVPGHEPPFGMAYLLLDEGPRIFVHTEGGDPLPAGSRAAVTAITESGDLLARPVEGALELEGKTS